MWQVAGSQVASSPGRELARSLDAARRSRARQVAGLLTGDLWELVGPDHCMGRKV
ncbi:UNVERIFIED_CONTAM: hypothetical protein Sradi_5229600 [Sesamum radiatum]|uniref:Uncharacterized protein n=1 Tax=Sesamum radiatum TaxID=300843 RepID=A0AAW2LL16_SESRA